MSFAYILECMFLALISTAVGINSPMITTGEKPTGRDALVAAAGWAVVYLIILAVALIIKAVKKKRGIVDKKEDTVELKELYTTNSAIANLQYLGECIFLTYLYRRNGKVLRSTGKKATKKEVGVFFLYWFTIAVVITFVVLLCVLLK